MKILLYNPDNGVTRNFMPHLWMFLLQALTPKEHEVILIDGNAKAMTRQELVRFCQEENIELVGIGAMTRMIARAYLVADALREAGIKVVMGGPHVTECPDEALGRDGEKRHADAVALGEVGNHLRRGHRVLGKAVDQRTDHGVHRHLERRAVDGALRKGVLQHVKVHPLLARLAAQRVELGDGEATVLGQRQGLRPCDLRRHALDHGGLLVAVETQRSAPHSG